MTDASPKRSMETAFLLPSPAATRRTRTRLDSHGPRFTILSRRSFGGAGPLHDRPCVLVLATQPDPWLGWLPLDEVLIYPSPA